MEEPCLLGLNYLRSEACVDLRRKSVRVHGEEVTLLYVLGGAKWFSTLELKSGYHQVKMAEEDKPKTAFFFGQGLWHFNVMPFDLCNVLSCFE